MGQCVFKVDVYLVHQCLTGVSPTLLNVCFPVWKPGPEAGSGREDPRSCPVSGPADVRLQGHPEGPGVHPLGPAGHCEYTGSHWMLGLCKQRRQTVPLPSDC